MKTKIETFLPVFPGFYGTFFEPCEYNEIHSIDCEREAKGLEPVEFDDIEFDYEDYNNRVANECCDFVEEKTIEAGIQCKVTFQNIHSPRFYNFGNDSINIEIEIDLNEVIDKLMERKDEFADHIKERYTSRSGFISHHSNDAQDWILALQKGDEIAHKLGACLEFLISEDDIVSQMHDYCIDHDAAYICAKNYDELIEA